MKVYKPPRTGFFLLLLFICGLWLSCEEDEFEEIKLEASESENREIGVLFEVPTGLIAGGQTLNFIEVSVTGIDSPTEQSAKFTLSQGAFEDGSKSVTKALSSAAKAALFVKSENPLTALLTAEVNGEFASTQLNFVAFDKKIQKQALTVLIDDTVALANGEEAIEIVLSLPDSVETDELHANLYTSLGTFNNGNDSVKAGFDSNRKARAQLRSTANGYGLLTIELQNINISQFIRFQDPALRDTITDLSISTTPGIADGATYSEIEASVDLTADFDPSLMVTFITDLGVFPNGQSQFSTTLGSDGNVKALLKSSDPGYASVTITTLEGYAEQVLLQFSKAEPEFLLLQIDSLALDSGESTTVKALLRRQTGSVSSDYEVIFEEVNSSEILIGFFSNQAVVSANNQASTSYMLRSDTVGSVNLKATVKLPSKDIVVNKKIFLNQ